MDNKINPPTKIDKFRHRWETEDDTRYYAETPTQKQDMLADKINEIVRYLNKLSEEK